ncbi:MAG: response regulator [Candidatus Spechtbacterales bacterium]|nr:response regulator [Candidatus Spechtbacterales bacterium]
MAKEEQKKILHMDNELDVLESVRAILERDGYEVKSASTVDETLSAIENEDYDLVLLDIMMPSLSGWDVFNRITKEKPDQKVAFLSALEVSPERKKALIKAGVVDYFTKPIDIKNFSKRIKSVLKD